MKKLGPIPNGDAEAVAWAILAKPPEWELGEWLSRIIPDGIWADMEPDELADQIVGAAVRARGEAPPDNALVEARLPAKDGKARAK